MKEKIIPIALCVALAAGASASAGEINSATVDKTTHRVSISGTADNAGERVTVEILYPNVSESDIDSVTPESFTKVFSNVFEVVSGADKKFTVPEYTLGDVSGLYGIRVMESSGEAPRFFEKAFRYISDTFEEELAAAAKNGTLYDFTIKNAEILTGFADKFSELSEDEKKTIVSLCESAAKGGTESYGRAFARAMFLKSGDEAFLTECGFSEDVKPAEYFKDFSADDKKNIVSGVSGKTLDEMTKSFGAACFIAKLATVSGSSGIEEILLQNEDWHKIDLTKYKALKSKKSVNTAIAEEKPQSISKLAALIDKEVSKVSGTSSGSGRTETSGRGGTGSAGFTPADKKTPEDQNELFTDLAGFDWAKEYIEKLAEKKIVSGTGEKKFSPERTVTREEFVKLICAAFADGGSEYRNNFKDVSASDWFAPFVARGVEKGIVKGIAGDRFGTGLNITREDMAVMAFKASGLSQKGDSSSFSDFSEISEYARDAVAAMKEHGIITGRGNNEFAPKAYATRAEAAKIICMLLDAVNGR